MRNPRLSICIPTYNRRQYIEETIASILGQVTLTNASQVEICISDNASTDGTAKLIKKIQDNSTVKIIYSRIETNIGADLNFLRVVELATADYCWFMGSDDACAPGSLEQILREIEYGHDAYICNRVDCNINMRPILKRFWLNPSEPTNVYNLHDEEQFFSYTTKAESVAALFAYLSSIVFKRKNWNEVVFDRDFVGTGYAHVFMLMMICKSRCTLKYLKDHLVYSRGENDSFQPPGIDGAAKRIMIDIDGYLLVANKLFKNSPRLYGSILRVLRTERPPLKTIIAIRIRCDEKSWMKITPRLLSAGYSKILIALIGRTKSLFIHARKMKELTLRAIINKSKQIVPD